MRLLTVLVVSSVSMASAAPSKPPKCVPAVPHLTLANSNGKALACWDTTGDCLALDDNKPVPRPAIATPAAEIRDDAGKPSACNATTCKPVGKKLAAAIAKVRAAHDEAQKNARELDDDIQPRFTVTADLTLVAIRFTNTIELWSVGKDKPLAPKKPNPDDDAKLTGIEAVGKLAFASWSVGSGTQEIALDADGANRNAAVEGGDTLALGDGYVVAGETGTLTVLDAGGRRSGAVDIKMQFASVVAVGSDEVVVVGKPLDTARGYVFAHVKITGGKPALGTTGSVPACATSP